MSQQRELELELEIPVSPDTTIWTKITLPPAAPPTTIATTSLVTAPLPPPTPPPTILFLHFWGGSARTWHRVLSHLHLNFSRSASPSSIPHPYIITPSLRGWGRSRGPGPTSSLSPSPSPSPSHAYSIPAYASDILALLSALRSGTYSASPSHSHPPILDLSGGLILVGHSMGGKIAQYLIASGALQNPSLNIAVKGLLLLAPAPLGGTRLETEEMRAQQVGAYMAGLERAEAVVRGVLLGTPTPTSGAVEEGEEGAEDEQREEEEIKALARDAVGGSKGAKEGWPAYGMGEDYGRLLEEKVDKKAWEGVRRVVVLVGENDRVESVERVEEEVVRRLREVVDEASTDVELRVLGEGCGHLIPTERPEEVAVAIKEMLS